MMSHAHLTLGDKLRMDSQEAEDEEDDNIKRNKILVIPPCHPSKGDNVLMSGDLWSRRDQWSTRRSSSFAQQWDRLCLHKAPRVSWQLRHLWSVSHPQDWRQSSRCIWNMSWLKSGIMIILQLTFHPRNVSPAPRARTLPTVARSGWGTRCPSLSRWPGPGTRWGGRRPGRCRRRPHQDSQSHPATWECQGRGNQNLSLEIRDDDLSGILRLYLGSCILLEHHSFELSG